MDQTHDNLIARVNRISPLNPVMLDLLAALQSDKSEVADLKRIIESDANTSATILKIANSPFYGMSGRVKTIQDACVLLGYDQLKNVIYATALDEATTKGPHLQWRNELRVHTLATAIIAREIEKQVLPRAGNGYSAGLLHELGKQVALAEFPDEFSAYMGSAETDARDAYTSLFVEIGAVLAKRWHLPPLLQACISYYRAPESAPPEFRDIVGLVSMAHSLADNHGYSSPGELSAEISGLVMIPDAIEPIRPVIKQRLDDVLQTAEPSSC